MTGGHVRVLRTPDEVTAVSIAARDDYERLFQARTGLLPPRAWCERWWPATTTRLPVVPGH